MEQGRVEELREKMAIEAKMPKYLCVDEHKLDSGYDKFINIIMKQTLQELQAHR